MPAFCLSIHASYRCAHTGACCTAGWPIPFEPGQLPALVARGLVPREPTAQLRWITRAEAALSGASPGAEKGGVRPDEPLLAATRDDGACVFFDADRGRRCAIHRDAGVEFLPASCRNFPRIALRDARGLHVTLSHYCPTAAGLLLAAGELEIVEAPASLTLDGEVEGLEATSVLPPLLRPGMLADYEGYAAWERLGVAVLNDRGRSPERALAVIAAATADTCAWRPGGMALASHAADAFARAVRQSATRPGASSSFDHPVKAFLAGHLFGNWAAYQRGGIMAVVDWLRGALAMLGPIRDDTTFIAAVRAADLRLRHTTDHVRPRPLSALRHD